jgi:hypothetical protein
VLLLVQHVDHDGLKLRIAPEWTTLVEDADRDYLTEVLTDWKKRATSDPQGLFNQIATLSVGPLVVRQVGSRLSESPYLLDLVKDFQEI